VADFPGFSGVWPWTGQLAWQFAVAWVATARFKRGMKIRKQDGKGMIGAQHA